MTADTFAAGVRSRIRFAPPPSPDSAFVALRHRVAALPLPDVTRARRMGQAKALVLLLVFGAAYLAFLLTSAVAWGHALAALLLGVICLPLILNVGHPAVHGTLGAGAAVNALGKSVFYLLGTSAYFWELRHLAAHHAAPNVLGYDLDIEQSAVIRLAREQPLRPWHRWQHVYMPLAFLAYTLLWFFRRDFLDLRRQHFGNVSKRRHPAAEHWALWGAKVWHLVALVALPLLWGASVGGALLGFLLFHLGASAVTTFILVSTHVGEAQEVLAPDANGGVPKDWLRHTLETTADFSTGSWLALHVFGGFNHHVAHHLFPDLSTVQYPLVTAEIERFCRKANLPYTAHANLWHCVRSHLRRLHRLSLDDI